MRIAHAKSFTRAIYSTHVVLLTKRADINQLQMHIKIMTQRQSGPSGKVILLLGLPVVARVLVSTHLTNLQSNAIIFSVRLYEP